MAWLLSAKNHGAGFTFFLFLPFYFIDQSLTAAGKRFYLFAGFDLFDTFMDLPNVLAAAFCHCLFSEQVNIKPRKNPRGSRYSFEDLNLDHQNRRMNTDSPGISFYPESGASSGALPTELHSLNNTRKPDFSSARRVGMTGLEPVTTRLKVV